MRRYVDIVFAWMIVLTMLSIQILMPDFPRLLTGALFLCAVIYLIYSSLTIILYYDFRTELRIAMTIGVFFTITIAVGILLNALNLPINRQTWLLSYSFIASIAFLTTAGARYVRKYDTPIIWNISRIQIVILGFAGVVAVAAFLLANVGLVIQSGTGFTQFWTLGNEDSLPPVLTIGIFNVERETRTYDVQLRASGNNIVEWEDITLDHNTKWEIEYELPEVGIVYPLEGYLFIDGEEEPYRRTEFWLTESTLPLDITDSE